MKPDMTLSEQKERETLASRVYAATVNWEAAARERDRAIAEADAAMLERSTAWHEWNAGKRSRDSYDATALACALLDGMAHDLCVQASHAWNERSQALHAENDFRRRLSARPDVTCEGCGSPATVIWSGEGYCADCNAMLEREAEQREAEQWTDYYHDVCGGLDSGNLRNR